MDWSLYIWTAFGYFFTSFKHRCLKIYNRNIRLLNMFHHFTEHVKRMTRSQTVVKMPLPSKIAPK